MTADRHIVIRPAVAADADVIHALLVQLAASTGAADKVTSTPDDFRHFGFSDSPHFEALLAEKDGTAVGLCLYFFTFSSWRGEPGIYIQDLYVLEQTRGAGLGRKLLADAVCRGAKGGATHLRLCVDHNNTAAHDFYGSCGMNWRDDDHVFEADGPAFLNIGGL